MDARSIRLAAVKDIDIFCNDATAMELDLCWIGPKQPNGNGRHNHSRVAVVAALFLLLMAVLAVVVVVVGLLLFCCCSCCLGNDKARRNTHDEFHCASVPRHPYKPSSDR